MTANEINNTIQSHKSMKSFFNEINDRCLSKMQAYIVIFSLSWLNAAILKFYIEIP